MYEWDDPSILSKLSTLIAAEADAIKERRIDQWRMSMKASYRERARWVMRAARAQTTEGDPHPAIKAKNFRGALHRTWVDSAEPYRKKWPLLVDE